MRLDADSAISDVLLASHALRFTTSLVISVAAFPVFSPIEREIQRHPPLTLPSNDSLPNSLPTPSCPLNSRLDSSLEREKQRAVFHDGPDSSGYDGGRPLSPFSRARGNADGILLSHAFDISYIRHCRQRPLVFRNGYESAPVDVDVATS